MCFFCLSSSMNYRPWVQIRNQNKSYNHVAYKLYWFRQKSETTTQSSTTEKTIHLRYTQLRQETLQLHSSWSIYVSRRGTLWVSVSDKCVWSDVEERSWLQVEIINSQIHLHKRFQGFNLGRHLPAVLMTDNRLWFIAK